MDFDVVLREVRLPGTKPDKPATDIGVKDGRIAAISAGLGGTAREEYRGSGRLVCSGFVDTHIHLDKACILGRCEHTTKRNPHLAMERVSAVKHTFTIEDVIERASATIEKCISHGATRMRTHAEVDPKVGLRGFEGVKALIDKYKWAIDLEICVMPQEGLTNNPGTDELMVAALKSGATVVGAAPNYDSDWRAQIRRIFEMAREFDVDIDMHLDSGASAEELHTLLVCDLTEKYKWGGRVAVGHVGKLATMPFKDLDKVARRMADAGVATTVLTATDLYLGGRHTDHNVPRNVVDLNRIPELSGVRETAAGIEIGAMTRQRALERDPIINAKVPVLVEALLHVGHVQTRSRGTLGGNLADFTAEQLQRPGRHGRLVQAGGHADPWQLRRRGRHGRYSARTRTCCC